jgi:hypothetical protein
MRPRGKSLRGRRPFALLDGLILLVPVAIGFALTRPNLEVSHWTPLNEWAGRWKEMIDHSERITSRFISVGMLGMLAVRLRRPRPGLRRLSRQPGAVACAAAATAMAAGGLVVGAMQMFREATLNQVESTWSIFQAWIPPAVSMAWAALVLGRRWRAEPSWIDRAGRFFGCYWIALAVYRWVMIVVGR